MNLGSLINDSTQLYDWPLWRRPPPLFKPHYFHANAYAAGMLTASFVPAPYLRIEVGTCELGSVQLEGTLALVSFYGSNWPWSESVRDSLHCALHISSVVIFAMLVLVGKS